MKGTKEALTVVVAVQVYCPECGAVVTVLDLDANLPRTFSAPDYYKHFNADDYSLPACAACGAEYKAPKRNPFNIPERVMAVIG